MSNNLYNTTLEDIKAKKQRILDGKLNCIPFDLGGFEQDLPGIEQEQLILITANSKVGKTQITDYLYLYTPLLYSLENPDKVKIKIFYFTLEVSKKKKMTQFMCYLLFNLSKGEIHIDMKSINSIFADKPVDDEIIRFLESPEYLRYADHIEKCVEFIDNKKNPTGMYKTVREYMEKPDVGYYGPSTTMKWQKEDGTYYDKEVKGTYTKIDSEEYVIAIIDHLALMQPEKGQKDVRDAMVYFSSHYALELRDVYKCTVVLVQQQASAQESVENKKADKLMPSMDGLGEAKITARDRS